MAALAAVGTFLAANAGTIATIATVAGTAVSAAGTIAAGKAQAEQLQQQAVAQKQAADLEARQLEIRANEERAAGQVEAAQFRRQKKLALSQLQARSAASGFSATDPTSLALADEIERYGSFQEQLALFGGEARQENFNLRAGATRFSAASAGAASRAEAEAVRRGSLFSAGGTILGGIGTAASRFSRQQVSTAAPFTGRYR